MIVNFRKDKRTATGGRSNRFGAGTHEFERRGHRPRGRRKDCFLRGEPIACAVAHTFKGESVGGIWGHAVQRESQLARQRSSSDTRNRPARYLKSRTLHLDRFIESEEKLGRRHRRAGSEQLWGGDVIDS